MCWNAGIKLVGLWSIITIFLHPVLLWADAPNSLEQQVEELIRQNRMLTERLEQVEEELRTLKAQPSTEEPVAVGQAEEERPWYDWIAIGIGATGIAQGAAHDGNRHGRTDSGGYATYSVDLEVSSEIGEHGQAFMLIETGDGDGVDGNADFATFGGVNGDAIGDQDLEVSELWYEHAWMEEMFRFRIGKLDITTDFDANDAANDEVSQFLGGQFINNMTVEFPDYCLGVMLWLQPTDLVSFGLGYGEADADLNDVFDRPFGIAELGLHPKVGALQGNYRFYAWANGQEHETWNGESDEEGYGFGVSLDQQVTSEVTLFARYGYAHDAIRDYAVEHAVSAGVQVAGSLWQRPTDVLGLAWGVRILNNSYEESLEAGGDDASDEHQLELYYRYQVNDHLAVTPDLQYVVNPEGVDDQDDLFVFGMRGQLNF